MAVPDIPFPSTWYALMGTPTAKQTGLVSQPVFGVSADDRDFIRVTDDRSVEVSYSSRAAIEEYLTNLGFAKATTGNDPELWTAHPPILVWTHFYDFVRVVEMRVLN